MINQKVPISESIYLLKAKYALITQLTFPNFGTKNVLHFMKMKIYCFASVKDSSSIKKQYIILIFSDQSFIYKY